MLDPMLYKTILQNVVKLYGYSLIVWWIVMYCVLPSTYDKANKKL